MKNEDAARDRFNPMDDDAICPVCGKEDGIVGGCECPECPKCGEVGRRDCYEGKNPHIPGGLPEAKTHFEVAWNWIGGDCGDLCDDCETLDEANEAGANWAAEAMYEGGMNPLIKTGDDGFPSWYVNEIRADGTRIEGDSLDEAPEWFAKACEEHDARVDATVKMCKRPGCDGGYIPVPKFPGCFDWCPDCTARAALALAGGGK